MRRLPRHSMRLTISQIPANIYFETPTYPLRAFMERLIDASYRTAPGGYYGDYRY
jgi:hypothetical protein